MYARRYQRKRSFKRVVVTLLTFVMLISVCMPGLYVSAQDGNEAVVLSDNGNAYYEQIQVLQSEMAALDEAAEDYEDSRAALQAQLDQLSADITEAAAAGEITEEEALYLNGVIYPVVTAEEEAAVVDAAGAEEGNDEPVLSETAQAYMNQIADFKTQYAALNTAAENYDDQWWEIYEGLAAVEEDAADDLDSEEITYDEFVAIYYAAEAVIAEMGDPYVTDLDKNDYDKPDGTGSYALSMDHYQPTSKVYYMVVTSEPAVYDNQNVISTVTLNSTDVVHSDSTISSNWSGGKTLSEYYPGLEKGGTDTSQTLSIEPADGYYVTRVVVACCGQKGTTNPFNCETWNANNAYEKEFSVSDQGTVTTDLPASAFGHGSDSANYFILISVAPIPSPLYVEYDYGEIDTLLGDSFAASVFANADGWTDDSTSNNYKPSGDTSDGGVQTEDTQFKYTYAVTDGMMDAQKAEAVQSWTHTTNTITAAARAAAAEIGYYFAGWDYTYYNDVNVSENGESSYNKYTYDFSNVYGTGSVGENTSLKLTTDVKLVAKWAPVELSVTKVVSGLKDSSFASEEHTYGLTVYKLNQDGSMPETGTAVELKVTGDGEASAVAISPVVPGATYVVKETSGNTNLGSGDDIMYIVVSDGDKATIATADQIAAGATANYNLTVTNAYSDATPKLKFAKVWKDVNGNVISGEATESFPSVTFNIAYGSTSTKATVSYESGWVTTMDIPSGYSTSDLTVTESVPTGFIQDGDIAVSTENDTVNQIFYTVYTATNKRNTTDVTVKKTVTGNMGDWSKEFDFDAYVMVGDTKYNLSAEIYDANGIDFDLANGGSETLSAAPIGSTLYIKETYGSYTPTVTYQVMSGEAVTKSGTLTAVDDWYSVTVEEGLVITFNNHLEASIDTGIELTSYPFILLLSTVLVGAFVLILSKRRYTEF